MPYSNFRGAVATKGIKYKRIAEVIGISTKALSNKINGRSSFTWEEVCKIQKEFFPEYKKDDLFYCDEAEHRNSA